MKTRFNIKNKKIISTIIFLLGFANVNYGQTLHAIIFAGTDDDSPNISRGFKNDFKDLTDEFQLIQQYAGLQLKTYYFTENDFKLENLRYTLDNLNCSNDDVIFFTYLGHGYRYSNQTDKWPYFSIEYGNVSLNQLGNDLISFAEIIQKLKSKNARLTIGFADCCNSEINAPEIANGEMKGVETLSLSFRNPERFKELYKYSKGTIFMSSSKPGEKSHINEDGSYFTKSFIEIEKELTGLSNKADWNSIAEKTEKRTKSLVQISNFFSGNCIQNPQYEINIYQNNPPNNNVIIPSWNNYIASNNNIFNNQPNNFTYNLNYAPVSFVVAKIVFFDRNVFNDNVFYLMSDNYIVSVDVYGRLYLRGYRFAPADPRFFVWDVFIPQSSFSNRWGRWGVDANGTI